MIKLTNMIFENNKFFEILGKVYDNKELEAPYAFNLYKLSKELEASGKTFAEFKQKLLDQYGKPDNENQGQYIIEVDQKSEFTKKFAELLNMDIEIKLEKFRYVSELSFSPSEFVVLENIFDYDQLENKTVEVLPPVE